MWLSSNPNSGDHTPRPVGRSSTKIRQTFTLMLPVGGSRWFADFWLNEPFEGTAGSGPTAFQSQLGTPGTYENIPYSTTRNFFSKLFPQAQAVLNHCGDESYFVEAAVLGVTRATDTHEFFTRRAPLALSYRPEQLQKQSE
jgi:hypothetical protein